MMLFHRAKLLVMSGALALGTLGGLTAAASPAHALTPITGPQYHPPANAYMTASPGCKTFSIWGGGPAFADLANSTDPMNPPYVGVTLFREDPTYGPVAVDSTFEKVTNYPGNPGFVTPWLNVSDNKGPGEYFATLGSPSIYLAYSNSVWC